jgi:hypothetical protein
VTGESDEELPIAEGAFNRQSAIENWQLLDYNMNVEPNNAKEQL